MQWTFHVSRTKRRYPVGYRLFDAIPLLQTVNFAVLLLKVLRVDRRVELFAKRLLQERAGLFEAAVLPDVLAVPRVDGREIAGLEALVHIDRLSHLAKQLRAVGAAERVGREVADAAARPMAVLQHAVLVVRHVDAEIFLVKAVPLARQVVHLEFAVHHTLFELVAHHDVQAVGDLVGLGADEGRLRLIDGAVEFLRRVAAQLGEQLAELREDEGREGAGAAEQVLIEAALALVDAHGNAAVEHRVGKLVRAAGIVERVAALVDNGEHRGGKILLQIVRRDALVKVRTERRRKRMLSRGQADIVQIEAHRAHQVVGKLRLLLLGKMAVQHRVIELRLRLDLLQERHDMLAQRREEFVALRHRQPILILAEPVVIGVLFRCAVVCEADVGLEDLFKHRLEESKDARLLRAVPDIVGLDKQLLVGDVLVHRDLLHVADVLDEQKHHALLLFVEFRLVRVEEFEQRDGLFTGRELVVLLAQNTHGLAAVRRRALGRGGRAVVKEQAHRVAVGRELGLQSHQGLDRFIESHDDLLTFSFSVKIS